MGTVIPFKRPRQPEHGPQKVTIIVPKNATPQELKRLVFEALGAVSKEEPAELREGKSFDLTQGKPPAPSIHRFRPKSK